MKKYNFLYIEQKWQKKWLKEKVFGAKDFSLKPKYYQLETFPYPSAQGLHTGHPKGYTAEDIQAHFHRMNGYEVLYTMGWDAFGLPTENYAIKVSKSPKEVAESNIANFKRQVQSFGFSYDWSREINTSSPNYYKWTQWLFIKLYEKGLAYRKEANVNWCPSCKTVLANEQVINGECERCHSKIEERQMEQWFLKITDYAERLINDLNGLDWPEATIKRQLDWIGKSEGGILSFEIKNLNQKIDVFTTRPDTLFGATFLILAPEHPIINQIKNHILNFNDAEKYIEATRHKTALMRKEGEREKSGVELLGIKAINPGTLEEIPIFIADYVLMDYGTGAIMGVPAHDERDFDFAKKFNLKIKQVIKPQNADFNFEKENKAYVEDGILINSKEFNGLSSAEARKKIIEKFNGKKIIQYKLRDWSVSRQRYWGVPIPMIYCKNCFEEKLKEIKIKDLKYGFDYTKINNEYYLIRPVPEKDLPVLLPDLKDYRPKGKPPLASSKDFVNIKCPYCGKKAQRDVETLDTFVDSSWYYFRYTDPHNDQEIFSKEKAKYWLPVDLYVIGAEHTVLHLLYSRFITKFLYDLGLINFKEPFLKLRHQGLILGADGQKMSKSRGNVVNPDEVIEKFGADTFRMYEMFMGPFEDAAPWSTKGVLGVHRFLNRFWNWAQKNIEALKTDKITTSKKALEIIHQTIKKVSEDIISFNFNTAISAFMILLNNLENEKIGKNDLELVLKIMYPFAPHICQELWSELGNKTYLDFEQWPNYDINIINKQKINLVIQINGRVRDVLEVQKGLLEEEVLNLAMSSEKIKKLINGKNILKTIYIQDKILNIII
ncbi:MAG: leucine--tRNA ligase [Candidatus Parcubacteria bacterium]|nr:MAG: leucine--tRNA ligase [Candidatus Parcubacteria bacterium]